MQYFSHLSGIATATNQLVKKLNNPKIKILDTRKTIPTLREIQKYAVKIGGGENHRFNLSEMVLIKENHLAGCKSIYDALKTIKNSPLLKKHKIEIEIEHFDELQQCVEYKPDIIMLDNMTIKMMQDAIKIIRNVQRDIIIEVSGNVTLDRLPELAMLDIDVISSGALTHSVIAADLSMKFL